MFGARFTVLLWLLITTIPRNTTAQSADDSSNSLFENHIRPVLVTRCIECHGPSKSESGLRLDSMPFLLSGGNSGTALIPGDPMGSLLMNVLDYEHDIKMPPDKPLNDVEIRAFREWITQGAPWPESLRLGTGPELRSGPATDSERSFWSFQPLSDSLPPRVDDALRIHNDIDRFVQVKLRDQALHLNAPADKQVLIRRVTFDLTGLPPTPEEIRHFLADDSPEAYEKLVERLLKSPAYGERWGRHWLDVVRYSDTAGETADYPVPDAWRYRNYVIDAFNKDKPYDQFLHEQIAGDLLAYQNVNADNFTEQVVATGFIAIARRFGFDSENYHHLTIQDTIDTVGQATLGLSLGCARCHDHKFDPVSMEDYYALYGVFDSTLYPLAGSEQKQKTRSLVPLRADRSQPSASAAQNQRTAKLHQLLRKLGRPIPPTVLRSLTDIDGDFELQSPASGGSRGVLVAPWLYDGPISVTNAAQSPFVDAFPAGRMGVSFPAGQAVAGIWQALRQRSINLAQSPSMMSIDFRVSDGSATNSSPSADIATDLITAAKSIASTQHHGLRIDLCSIDMQPVLGVLIGGQELQLQIDDQVVDIGTIKPNSWYCLKVSIFPAEKIVQGQLSEHQGAITHFDQPIHRLPEERLTQLRLQTSRQRTSDLPMYEVDNLVLVPGEVNAMVLDEPSVPWEEIGDPAALQAELDKLLGIDGDLELQVEGQPPSKPWNPGPNSVVKLSAEAQSPFRNYYAEGRLGIHLPNRGDYDGFGLQLANVRPDDSGHLRVSWDFRCASQLAGGAGSWRYYLGHGPGQSAAIELFMNGEHFFRRSLDAKDAIADIQIGVWYQVQLDLDFNAKTYTGKLVSSDSEIDFGGEFATGWDGFIDYSFIDSYGHIGGVRPSLDADNFYLSPIPGSSTARSSQTPSSETATSFDSSTLSPNKRIDRIRELRQSLESIQTAAENLEKQLLEPPSDMGYAIAEGTPHDVAIQLRGEPSMPGKLVPRRMPELFRGSSDSGEAINVLPQSSGRLELARWITQEAKPLAARVMVNRIWQQHFGRGLVRTENDFGTRGERPTHPELLDWLACRFIESGWSIKHLHRLILSSAVYQQSSRPNEEYSQIDPENRWLWRFSPRRLSAEEIRDAILLVSGSLDPSMGNEHPFPAPHTWGFTQHAPFYAVYESNRRSVYLMQQRIKRHPFLALFDGADPNVSTARREMTIVPTQALYLMNNPFIHEASRKITQSLEKVESPAIEIDRLYWKCLGRGAREDEIERAIQFLARYDVAQANIDSSSVSTRSSSWAALVRTLITRNEFLFVE